MSFNQARWDKRTTCRQTAMVLPRVEGKAWKIVRKMNRNEAMYVTQIITGHNSLKRHLNIMGIEECPTCERCQQEPETIEHVIKYCPAYMNLRRKILGEYVLSGELSTYKLQKILNFVGQTKRLNFDMN